MAERILVPLDGSSFGEAALNYVRSFLADMNPKRKVTVVLLHVINNLTHVIDVQGEGEIPVVLHYTPEEIEEMKQKILKYLTRASKTLQESGAEVESRIFVGENPAEEIIKAEKELKCDLVAMSTHGRSGLGRFAFGSVADKVLRGGTLPVLLVRAKK
jgi:nucleotide-binding universal stress UspA family protein